MTLHLIVGLPGAGKTTRAKELEAGLPALRLTPDDWQMAVFSRDGPTAWRSPERVEQRDRLEGKLVEVGLRAARLGLDVVLDFGLWGRDERSALRWMAASLGVAAQVVYLPVSYEQQRERVASRFHARRGEFQLDDEELQRWQGQFQVPEPDELGGHEIPPVDPAYGSWWEWAAERWPSLPVNRP